MARILLVGTATLDLVFELEHHPAPDEEMRAKSLRTCRGGNAANTAVVLSRLGHRVEFFGVLADAAESAVIERDFDANDVIYSHCPRLPGRPPTSSICLTGAHRSIVHYRDLPELSAGHFDALDFAAYDLVHFECRNVDVLQPVFANIRKRYPALSISLELEKPRPGMETLFAMPDLLICSRVFAEHQGCTGPDTFLKWMQERAPRAIVIAAWGEQGAYGAAARTSVFHAPAIRLEHVVDTLGAGDTFNAGVLDGYAKGLDPAKMLANACLLAGKKCAVRGFDFSCVL